MYKKSWQRNRRYNEKINGNLELKNEITGIRNSKAGLNTGMNKQRRESMNLNIIEIIQSKQQNIDSKE